MKGRRFRRVVPWLPVLGLAFLGLGCSWVLGNAPMDTLKPTTDAGKMILQVYGEVGWWILGIFIVVESLLVFTIFRFRRRPGQEGLPKQVHGNTPLEIGWTLVPLLIVIAIAFPSIRTTFALKRPAAKDAIQITVVGKQWWWKFEYPQYGVVTANELHLPLGRMANLHLTSDNVIHSFWVPRLMGKRDLVPGRGQYLWFTPEKTGWFDGQCAELCGASHANMRMRVKIDTPQEFRAWIASQKKPADTRMTAPGFQLFMRTGCIACHTISFPGSPARADIGPNLTHVASRTTIAGATLQNTQDQMAHWIQMPDQVKPGSKMPNLGLSHAKAEQLAAFLQTLH